MTVIDEEIQNVKRHNFDSYKTPIDISMSGARDLKTIYIHFNTDLGY